MTEQELCIKIGELIYEHAKKPDENLVRFSLNVLANVSSRILIASAISAEKLLQDKKETVDRLHNELLDLYVNRIIEISDGQMNFFKKKVEESLTDSLTA